MGFCRAPDRGLASYRQREAHATLAAGKREESEMRESMVEIDVQGRWDALALSEALSSYHSFLVQLGDQRWVVHARAPGCHGEPLEAALGVIDGWAEGRGIAGSSCRVGGRPHELSRSAA
jgi:hypothetical protein